MPLSAHTERMSQTSRTFLDLSQHRLWLPVGQILLGKGAEGNYLKTYVLFISKMLVPFPANGKGELIQTWRVRWTDPRAASLPVRWVLRNA